MLVTSMFSLKYINVAMVTVLKNVTNVMTDVGDMYLFNKHHDNCVWTALFLMDNISSSYLQLTSTPSSTHTDDSSSITPPEAWGGERLSEKSIKLKKI
ncbi:hypothetical protein ACS0TY_001989 [Phlomoides rotata]